MGAGGSKRSEAVVLQNSFEFKGHSGNIQTLKYYNPFLYSASKDGTIRQWDAISGACMFVFKGHNGSVACLRFEGDVMYSCSSDATCRAWNVKSQREMHVFRGHEKTISCICIDTASGWMYTGSFDRSIRKWAIEGGYCEQVLQGHTDSVVCIQIHDSFLYSGSSDLSIKKWDPESGECLMTFEGHTGWVMDLCFHNRFMFSASMDGQIRKWDLKGGSEESLIVMEGHQAPVSKLEVAASGKFLVTASWDGNVGIFDAGNGKGQHMFRDHQKPVRQLSVVGKLGITGSDDLSAKVFDLKRGQCLFTLPHGREIVSIAKGHKNLVYTACKDNIIRKWELPLDNIEEFLQAKF